MSDEDVSVESVELNIDDLVNALERMPVPDTTSEEGVPSRSSSEEEVTEVGELGQVVAAGETFGQLYILQADEMFHVRKKLRKKQALENGQLVPFSTARDVVRHVPIVLDQVDQEQRIRTVRSTDSGWSRLVRTLPNFQRQQLSRQTKVTWLFHDLFPILYQYLDNFSSILLCRKVCREWRRSVDYYLKTKHISDILINQPGQQVEKYQYLSYQQLLAWDVFNISLCNHNESELHSNYNYRFFDDSGAMRIFEIEVVYRQATPFLSGIVTFNQSGQAFHEFWPQAISLLKQFGRDVSVLEIVFKCEETYSYFNFVDILYKCLREVPNLLGLHFDVLPMEGWQNQPANPKFMHKYKKKTAVKAFPDMPHLRSLIINTRSPPQPFTLFEELITFPSRYYKQLQVLEVKSGQLLEMLRVNSVGDPFPNLSTIKLNVTSLSGFELLCQLSSPLKRVRICFHGLKIRLARVFEVLSRFGGTLCVLDVYFGKSCYEVLEEGGSCTPEPGCSTSSCLQSTSFPSTAQFFHFPELKMIYIYDFYDEPLNDLLLISSNLPPFSMQISAASETLNTGCYFSPLPGDLLQVHGYWDKFYESVIWKLIPALREFAICVKHPVTASEKMRFYDRSKYSKLQEAQMQE